MLGARQVLQAAVTRSEPGPVVLVGSVATDVAHAASMLGLAAVAGRWRRAALVDAALASAFAAAGVLAVRAARRADAGASVWAVATAGTGTPRGASPATEPPRREPPDDDATPPGRMS